jgi:predicted hotdog family 3-hydroxylacyl-ACP dehydratase
MGMSTTTLTDLTLEDLLPHRGAMLLVKEILAVDSKSARALFLVDSSWPMADGQGVHPLILVELAAQTAGVCNGWDRIQTKGRDSDQMGWLVGIKKADFGIDSLPFGSIITARAENTYSFESLREVSCELEMDNQTIGRATLQLFQVNQ